YVEWDAANGTAADLIAATKAALPTYRDDYARYYKENQQPDSPAMRPANPTVVLVPGVGLFSFGKTKAEARTTGEFYINAIHVMEGATALAEPAAPDPLTPHPPLSRAKEGVTDTVVSADTEAAESGDSIVSASPSFARERGGWGVRGSGAASIVDN